MTYDADEGVVTIASDKREGPTAGTHRFDALEFLAKLLAHVPRKREMMVRYCGAYSVRRRAAWRKSGIRVAPASSDDDGTGREPEEPMPPTPERIRAMRRRWAELLRRIWNVDVLTCPNCSAPMNVLAFTLDPSAIASTLRCLRSNGVDPRAGPWASLRSGLRVTSARRILSPRIHAFTPSELPRLEHAPTRLPPLGSIHPFSHEHRIPTEHDTATLPRREESKVLSLLQEMGPSQRAQGGA
jgi:hypothetical protein